MNKSARILFLVVALMAASFISYIVYQRTASQPTVLTSETSQDIVKIAVVDRDLKKGVAIVAKDLHMAPYLKKTLPKGHFTDLNKAVGRIVVKPIMATEAVLESALASADLKKGGMAAIIPPEKRAMAVKVNDVIGVAGFLTPGHSVDVLVSLEKPGNKRIQITKTVLENIPVLAIGTQLQERDDKKPKKVTVVTLEVDLEEAEKLALAVNQGNIQIALRGYSDTNQILTKGMTIPTLLKSYATASNIPVKVRKTETARPKAKTRPRVTRKPLVIEVMNGNTINRLTMKSN